MSNKTNKFESFILASYLDTIGFLNGYMEFNEFNYPNNKRNMFAELLHHHNIMNFFKLGGFSLNLKKYTASDDTILNIANGKVLTNTNFTINDFINSYLDYFDIIIEDRGIGLTTEKSLKNLKKVRSPLSIEYNENDLGNGSVMRSCIFGLKYNYKSELNLLQKWVIETSKLTHNNIESSISSLITAIFTSMAINKIIPFYWIQELDKIKNQIKFNNKKELDVFNTIIQNLENINNNRVIFNTSFSYSNKKKDILFDPIKINKIIDTTEYPKAHLYGGLSYDLLYIAYDILINSITIDNNGEEKVKNNTATVNDITPNFMYLFMNSSLNFGDSDTFGCVCGFWYGALFGFNDVPNINFKDLEFYETIKNITKNI